MAMVECDYLSGGGGTEEFDFNPTTEGNTKTFTARFKVKTVWVLSPCATGFYWNRYTAGDSNIYQFYGTSATPINWNVSFPNGTSGITFTISGNTVTFATGGVSNFNVKNRIVLIG